MTGVSVAANGAAMSLNGTPTITKTPGAKDKRYIRVAEPEKQDGNTEYKRQLLQCTPTRLEKLKTQMSFRLDQGDGCCIYRIGVEDDGCHSLIDYPACAETARILEYLARSLNAVVMDRTMIQNEVVIEGSAAPSKPSQSQILVVREDSLLGDGREQLFEDQDNNNSEEKKNDSSETSSPLNKTQGVYTRCNLTIHRVETHMLDPSPIAEDVKIRRAAKNGTKDGEGQPLSVGETLSTRNLRVAVVGNVDAGKSTMIGTLTSSLLDDGRGSSRTSIMKHRHEIESGRTSTASSHLLGFQQTGQAIAGKGDSVRAHRRKSDDEIARESYRVVTLMDLAGHEKYLKTTIHGVASGMADYALILVNSRHPPTHMTHHHLNLCVSFGIHVVIVFTKIDGCPEHAFKTSKQEVCKLLRRSDIGKQPFELRTEADIATCLGKLGTLAPMVSTSCVTGEGVELLQKLLFALPKRRRHERKLNRSFEYLVDDIFNVPGVGSVVSGFVNAGSLDVGPNANVYVGPTDDGSFLKTVAKSAHIARINTGHVTSGQSACLALALSKEHRKKLRRGMVVLEESPTSTREFEAEICVLKGEGTTIRKTYQAYVHILNVRQSAFAKKIEIVHTNVLGLSTTHTALYGEDNEIVLRPGSRAKVRFQFAQRPEYVRPGMRMLFRDGRVRGVGLVTAVPTVEPAH
jgi:GTPase